MTYATEAKVKERCGIESADVEHDTEVANAMTYGDAFVGGRLGRYGLSADESDQGLIEAACDFATFYYLRNRGQREAAAEFKESAKELVDDYCWDKIAGVHRTGGPPYRPPHLE